MDENTYNEPHLVLFTRRVSKLFNEMVMALEIREL